MVREVAVSLRLGFLFLSSLTERAPGNLNFFRDWGLGNFSREKALESMANDMSCRA